MSAHNGVSANGVLGRSVLTLGQVARLVGVAPRTAAGWCNKGLLKCYRIPGGAGDRRIQREDLERFLREHNLPFSLPEQGVLLVGYNRPPVGWAGITVAADTFAAGVAMAQWVPALVVVDAGQIGRRAASTLAVSIRDDDRWKRTRLVLVVADDDGEPTHIYDELLRGEDGLRAARGMAAGVTGGRP